MDREAWRATVHGVTKSQTRLSAFAHRPLEYCSLLPSPTTVYALPNIFKVLIPKYECILN